MSRSRAVPATVALVAIAAVSCCTPASRAETVTPVPATTGHGVVASLGGSSGCGPAAGVVSEALLRSLASGSEAVGYHSGLSTSSFGTQVVRHASGMGFGFDTVPFESFLSVAAAPNGENVVRAFIIIEDEKSKRSDATSGEAAGDELVNRFTQASPGTTTTSGSATLSILQIPHASSALVYTNVVLKGGARATE